MLQPLTLNLVGEVIRRVFDVCPASVTAMIDWTKLASCYLLEIDTD